MKNAITGKILTFLTAWLLLCLSGCASLKELQNLSIGSYRLESLSIGRLTDLDADISLTVDNPSKEIAVTLFEGTVYLKDKPLGTFTSEGFTIPGRTTAEVPVSLQLTLDPSVSALSLMSLASKTDVKDLTIDLTLKARLGKGASKKFTFKDMPLDAVIRNFK